WAEQLSASHTADQRKGLRGMGPRSKRVPAGNEPLRDTLERLHDTEQALAASEERYRLLAENSLDQVALLDPTGTILYASPSHSRVLGYQPDELIQTALFDRIHPDDLPQARAAVQAVLADHTAIGGEWRLLRQTGEHIIATVQLSLSTDQRGTERLIVTARDITAWRQAEAAVRQSDQRLRALI